jgi:hypothetical protein
MPTGEEVLKKVANEAGAKARKSINQAKKLKALWLREEAKAVIWDQISNQADTEDAEEIADILEIDDLGSVSPKAVMNDLADIALDSAIDFVGDDGVDAFADIRELQDTFIKELRKVRV